MRWVRATICATAFLAGEAAAVPVLQLYIEGASYDSQEESWYFPGREFRLWAIGNLTGPGGTGGAAISNLRLAAVYSDPGTPVSISITPTQIGGTGTYKGFTDGMTPVAPTLIQIVSDGATPEIGNNRHLPSHGEYGIGKTWQEFALGEFNVADSQLGDFIHAFPVPGLGTTAQINAYDVRVEGADAHFDLYGMVTDSRGRTSHVFAPFSHDATDGAGTVPVPSTLPLLGISALGFLLTRCRRGRNASSIQQD